MGLGQSTDCIIVVMNLFELTLSYSVVNLIDNFHTFFDI